MVPERTEEINRMLGVSVNCEQAPPWRCVELLVEATFSGNKKRRVRLQGNSTPGDWMRRCLRGLCTFITSQGLDCDVTLLF